MNGPLLFLPFIPLLPFAGFALNGVFGSKLPKPLVTAIGLLAPLGSFALVARLAYMVWSGALALPVVEANVLAWISVGDLHVDFGSVLDPLSLTMLLIVTGVGFLIHVYSVGYMHGDKGYWRYFAYMNLFLFFMTLLVQAGNILLMFVGWEGVGLASYLLIGFWYQKTTAAEAGKKAFIVNRIGDFGFLIGIFLLLGNFGTLTFSEIAARLAASPGWTGGILTTICICLLIGATGKSAQLPLYVWLPDAMEGPTPVSALIHAATMVTAGVYMIARTHFLFDRSPVAMLIVACIGAATALFAATIGLVQNDIKRVLAYSTISQLGYMFLACGVAAYSAAIFHLMTHAFFKALLFLAAGSVIHGLGGEQDLRRMGGLRKHMPVTFWTMTAAVLAISGFFPFAGFFSKDAILYAAFLSGTNGKIFWAVGLFTALLTSFYMFRLWYLAFMGKPRSPELHAHESGWSMLGPLVILGILSVCGGWIGAGRMSAWLAPAVGAHTAEAANNSLEMHAQRSCGGGCGAGLADCAHALSRGIESRRATGDEFLRSLQAALEQVLGGRTLRQGHRKAAAGDFAICAGVGCRIRDSGRAGVAAVRDSALRRRGAATMAVRQSAIVCGMACGRSGGVAGVCLGAVFPERAWNQREVGGVVRR